MHVFKFIAGNPAMYGAVACLAAPRREYSSRGRLPHGWSIGVHVPPLLKLLRFDFNMTTSGETLSTQRGRPPALLQDGQVWIYSSGLLVAGRSNHPRRLAAELLMDLLPQLPDQPAPVSTSRRVFSLVNHRWASEHQLELANGNFACRQV